MIEEIKYLEFSSEFSEKVKTFLIDVCIQEFGFEAWREELETTDREKYKRTGGIFLIALDKNGDIIGTIGLENMNDGVGLLKTMYVRKDYRGSKIAQNLMNTLINFSLKNNYTKLQLGTHKELERAVNFYKKNGFYLKQEDDNVLIFEKILCN